MNLYQLENCIEFSPEDFLLAKSIIGTRTADLVIAPAGDPYLYRWYILPHNKAANVYFHIQVADDPKRPLHDHPWDNQSVILAGGYDEIICPLDRMNLASNPKPWMLRPSRKGDVVARKAEQAHRLLLARSVRYTMTLFSTGPKRRKWGFWYPEGWVDADEVCCLDGNISKHLQRREG